MIEIEIDDNSIAAHGHSKDLICNSVSVLMWSLAISLDHAKAKDMVVIEGDGEHLVECSLDDTTRPIFEGYAESLKLMGEQFPEEIEIYLPMG